MLEDTIIAVSTPPGHGGIGVARLSGRRALAVAKTFFRARKGRIQAGIPVLGDLVEPGLGEAFDEAFLTYFKKPHSYTREDVVELSCHGSPVVLEEVIRLGILAGARQADPGEFTLRAYLNGRLDIVQSEAVNDLVRAVSLAQAKVSFRQLGGSLSGKINAIRTAMVRVISEVEAGIEFPDEKLMVSKSRTIRELGKIIRATGELIAGYDAGRALAEGIELAIAGRTNVGKSTLFNVLLGEDRAIVTRFPGTTRDFLKEKTIIHDTVYHLIDMAGLGKPSHPVEREGIKRGERLMREADGVLLVIDASRGLSLDDKRVIERLHDRRKIFVINKIDLTRRIERRRISGLAGDSPVVEISALSKRNIGALREKIHSTFGARTRKRGEMILHARQKLLLQEALGFLVEARALFCSGHPEEIGAEELRKAIVPIGRLTGEIRSQDILDDIFGRFCVGK
jgi:tRNA modification GTPase